VSIGLDDASLPSILHPLPSLSRPLLVPPGVVAQAELQVYADALVANLAVQAAMKDLIQVRGS
jgi:hypothetical protein